MTDAGGGAAPVPVLQIDRLTKRYGSTVALDGVSLALGEGTAYGLVGPNGGGKSTLLRIVATLDRPTSGRVVVQGLDTLRAARKVRRLIGYAGPPVGTPELTVTEELAFTAQLAGVGRAEQRETTAAMLQLVDLYDRRHRPVGALSRGDLKRLAIARALVHDPSVVLLDEPFDGLDAAARGELRAVLAELAALGKTLLITAATVAELASFCDGLGLLDRGRLLLSGPVDAVLAGGEIGRPLRLRVTGGVDVAHERLGAHPQVHGLVALDEEHLLFRFDGGATDQAALMADLIVGGVAVTELGRGVEEAEAELARLVRAGG